MLRISISIILAASGVGFVRAQADRLVPTPGVAQPKLPPAPPGQEWRPDPAYAPKLNDRASTFGGPGFSVATIDRDSIDASMKAVVANDEEAIGSIVRGGKAAFIRNGTGVMVVEKTVIVAPPEGDFPACRVRFLDGPYKDQEGWIMADGIVRLQLSDRPGTPSPEERAETLLRAAQALEKAGKFKPALANYREILSRYPASAPAKVARERAEILKGK